MSSHSSSSKANDAKGSTTASPLYTSALPVEVELPSNVSTLAQLEELPDECKSDDPRHPLLFTDDRGDEYCYHLNPMLYSVVNILIVELLERFAFYGINYTQASYMTGAYNRDWNADMQAVQASSFVSISVAIAYTMPFFAALVADSYLGEYHALLGGAVLFYIPGLVLIACTAVPYLLGPTFNQTALLWGLLFLWPVGTGSVKSIVNVFGAKQFHPILQASLIESYYVNFYMCINVGALAGGILVPQMAQYNVSIAYWIPVGTMTLGVLCFLAGTSKYVRTKPRGQFRLFGKGASKKTKKNPYEFAPPTASSSSKFSPWIILKISLLIFPFNIAYSQMATTFIVQGIVMKKAFGCIDAASMNNADAIAVLLFGYIIGNQLYPWLARNNIKLATTHKFAIGSALGAMAVAWALFVEYLIHTTYAATGEPVNIAWQSVGYVLIGAGEIFAVSAAYEVAFTASPPESKSLASAINLFCVGGLPNYMCIALYQACAPWFRNQQGTSSISTLDEYAQAEVYKYFGLLLGIACSGIVVNLLPAVRDWVAWVEEEANQLIKSPMTTPMATPRARRQKRLTDDELADRDKETTALLSRTTDELMAKAKDHQNYLKYGSGPELYKHGSFRAGILQTEPKKQPKRRPSKYVQYPMGMTLFNKAGGTSTAAVRDTEAQTMRGLSELQKKLDRKDMSMDDADANNLTL